MLFVLEFIRRPWVIGLNRILLLAYIVLISVLSLLPSSQLPSVEVSDKIQHALAYAGLSVLAILGFANMAKLKLALICIGLGLLLEIGQYFIPGRFLDFWDLVANSSGVVVILWLWAMLEKRYLEALR